MVSKAKTIRAKSTDHSVSRGVCSFDIFGLLKRALAYDFDPISVRIQSESNVPHSTICQLLLELVTGILDPLTSSLNVVYTDASMSKTPVWLRVTGGNFVFGIIFGSVVVGQFDETLTVAPVIAMGNSLRGIIAHKVKVKLGFRLLNLSNHCHAEVFIELN